MNCVRRNYFTKSLVLLLSLCLVLTSVGGGTLAYLFTRTPELVNTFLSGLRPDGALVISKEVEHPFGSAYVLPEGLSFDFTVALGEDYAGKTVETSVGQLTADDKGVIAVSVVPGGVVRVEGLDKDRSVIVTELEKAGFTPRDGAERTVVVEKGDNLVAYINDYVPAPVAPVNLAVGGTKVLEGRDWQAGDKFTLRLEYKAPGAEEWKELDTADVVYETVKVIDPATGAVTVQPKPDFDKFRFDEAVQALVYDAVGEYSFRVSEISGDLGGISYDQTVSYFDVTVTDTDMDGALEIRNVQGYQNAEAVLDENDGFFRVNVTVSNTYAPSGTSGVMVKIGKTVTSLSGEEKSAAGYTFDIYDEEGKKIATSGATSAAGETSITLTFEAKDAGKTFLYTVKETGAGETKEGMTYDDTVYCVSVTVVDDLDGTISTLITAQEALPTTEKKPEASAVAVNNTFGAKEESKESELPENICQVAFENVYDPADALLTLSGTKTLTGRDWKEKEQFTFQMFAADENFAVAENAQPVVTAVCAKAEDGFTFPALGFDKVGTYRYTVTEADGGTTQKGVTYDDTVYRVTVTVTDDKGVLQAAAAVIDDKGNAAQLQFENTYRALPAEVIFSGTKTLKGGDLTRDQFQFQLFAADENYTAEAEALAGASNDDEGIFDFEAISFDKAGTYYYTVKEDDSADLPGVTYDETVYGIRVEVWDDGEGQMQASTTVCVVGGSETETIAFENLFVESPPTGDRSQPALYMALLVLSAAAAVLLMISRKQKRQR